MAAFFAAHLSGCNWTADLHWDIYATSISGGEGKNHSHKMDRGRRTLSKGPKDGPCWIPETSFFLCTRNKSIESTITENHELISCRLCHHWQEWGLPPVMTKLASWQLLVFSDDHMHFNGSYIFQDFFFLHGPIYHGAIANMLFPGICCFYILMIIFQLYIFLLHYSMLSLSRRVTRKYTYE